LRRYTITPPMKPKRVARRIARRCSPRLIAELR
jgi:hypothetical protein